MLDALCEAIYLFGALYALLAWLPDRAARWTR